MTDTELSSLEQFPVEQGAKNGAETIKPEDIIDGAYAGVAEIDARVAEAMGLALGSPEANAESDLASVYSAESEATDGDDDTVALNQAIAVVVAEGKMEDSGERQTAGENPVDMLRQDGLGEDVDRVEGTFSQVKTDETQLGTERIVPRYDFRETTELIKDWSYNEKDGLVIKIDGKLRMNAVARDILKSGTYLEDESMAREVEGLIDSKKSKLKDDLSNLEGQISTLMKSKENVPADQPKQLEYFDDLITQLNKSRDDLIAESQNIDDDFEAVDLITRILIDREKQSLERAMDQRRAQDELPWTMPVIEVPDSTIRMIQESKASIIDQNRDPDPDDIYRILSPMNGVKALEDIELLASIGIDFTQVSEVSRADLQKAGVFFVNRIGDGEQPIFGVSIPDPESETGFFDVSKRTLLTREEFDKVYRYQQEHGYGIGDADPKDVQMDMIVFGMRAEKNSRGLRDKTIVPGSRVSKYGKVFSPFVDIGYVNDSSKGFEGNVSDPSNVLWGGRNNLRMNEIVVHLVNAHPDYPGTSEMFDVAAHDQMYMSAGDFMKVYQSLPTDQELYYALAQGLPTAREKAWVGGLSI